MGEEGEGRGKERRGDGRLDGQSNMLKNMFNFSAYSLSPCAEPFPQPLL